VAWLNRKGARRRPDIPEPDHEWKTLEGVLEIL
jgi:hypothetical protein